MKPSREDKSIKKPIEYMTTRELAQFVGCTPEKVSRICAEGKVAGALKKGHTWLIPKSAVHVVR